MKKKIYKSVIVLEVLSDDPITNESLQDIVAETINDNYSGNYDFIALNKEVSGKKAVDLCKKHGTDTEFFNMDLLGNEIIEEDENLALD